MGIILPQQRKDMSAVNPDEFQPKIPLTASVGAAFNREQQFTPVHILDNREEVRQIAETAKKNEEPILSAEELNSEFLDVATPFTEGLPYSVASKMNDQAGYIKNQEQKMQMGPDTYTNAGLQFAAGIFAHVIDPIEWIANVVTGYGISALAKGILGAGLKSGIIGRAAKVKLGRPLQALANPSTFANAAVEGIVSGVATDIGIVQRLSRPEVENIHGMETLRNIVIGSLGISAAVRLPKKLLGMGHRSMNKTAEWINNDGSNVSAKMVSTALNQMETGRDVDVTPIARSVENMKKGKGTPDTVFGQYIPIDRSVTELPAKQKMYVAMKTEKVDGESFKVGNNYGDGVYLSADPNVSNGIAGNPWRDGKGSIIETDLEGLNIMSLEQPIDLENKMVKDFIDSAEDAFFVSEDFDGGLAMSIIEDLPEGATLKDLLDGINDVRLIEDADEAIFEHINNGMSSRGYDGTFYHTGDSSGMGHPDTPVTMLYDQKKMKTKTQVEVRDDFIPQPSDQDTMNAKIMMSDPKNQLYRNPELEEIATEYAKFNATEEAAAITEKMTYLNKEIAIRETELLERLPELSNPKMRKLFDSVEVEVEGKKYTATFDQVKESIKRDEGIMDLYTNCRITTGS